jgi:hypothetical protein
MSGEHGARFARFELLAPSSMLPRSSVPRGPPQMLFAGANIPVANKKPAPNLRPGQVLITQFSCWS